MLQPLVIFQKSNHIARITINRPDANNLINLQMGQEMDDICHQINQDNDIYVVIITGAGDVFCGGNELEKSEDAKSARVSATGYLPMLAAE